MITLEEAIQKIAKRIIWTDFRHVRLPQTMLALVTKGGTLINLKILDENEEIDERFAEIPELPTETDYEEGDKVIITFLYGKIELPIIIRKWNQCH